MESKGRRWPWRCWADAAPPVDNSPQMSCQVCRTGSPPCFQSKLIYNVQQRIIEINKFCRCHHMYYLKHKTEERSVVRQIFISTPKQHTRSSKVSVIFYAHSAALRTLSNSFKQRNFQNYLFKPKLIFGCNPREPESWTKVGETKVHPCCYYPS
jgi:hypothetical protein